jgi:hypothetical protein
MERMRKEVRVLMAEAKRLLELTWYVAADAIPCTPTLTWAMRSGRPPKDGHAERPSDLADLGISNRQSSEAKKIPEDEFLTVVHDIAAATGHPPTTSGIIRAWDGAKARRLASLKRMPACWRVDGVLTGSAVLGSQAGLPSSRTTTSRWRAALQLLIGFRLTFIGRHGNPVSHFIDGRSPEAVGTKRKRLWW